LRFASSQLLELLMPRIWHVFTLLIPLTILISLFIQPGEILPIQNGSFSVLSNVVQALIYSCSSRFRPWHRFIALFIGSVCSVLPSSLLEEFFFFYCVITIFSSINIVERNLLAVVRPLLLLFLDVILKPFLEDIELLLNSVLVAVNGSLPIHGVFVQAVCIKILLIDFVGNFEIV
jgi:hypothetical protein